MSKSAGSEDIQEQALLLRQQLLGQLAEARRNRDLTQSELAEKCALTRMTVQRAEREGENLALSSFLALSVGLGLTPRLLRPGEMVTRVDDANAVSPHPENIVHRGYHHNRTRHGLTFEDRKREAVLARNWEAINQTGNPGWGPIVEHLVPDCSQEQASAMATVVQWLGSEVGFQFLTHAMKEAGYSLQKVPVAELSRKKST